jgi:hypothetical protein
MTSSAEALLELVDAHPDLEVEELIERLSGRLGNRRDQAAKTVYQLWQEDKITLWDANPPRSLLRYSWSHHSTWFWLLVSVVALATLSIYVLPQEVPYIYLRYIVGALSVLYLPGAALIEALYPKEEDLQPLERLALSIGLSLALVPLMGLVLNYTPWGIRLDPIFASLCLLTLGLAAAAVVRKFGYFRMKLEAAVAPSASETRKRLS